MGVGVIFFFNFVLFVMNQQTCYERALYALWLSVGAGLLSNLFKIGNKHTRERERERDCLFIFVCLL